MADAPTGTAAHETAPRCHGRLGVVNASYPHGDDDAIVGWRGRESLPSAVADLPAQVSVEASYERVANLPGVRAVVAAKGIETALSLGRVEMAW